jgi:hypothetical protein
VGEGVVVLAYSVGVGGELGSGACISKIRVSFWTSWKELLLRVGNQTTTDEFTVLVTLSDELYIVR